MNLNKSRLCCGNSIISGKPCRKYAVTGDFCRCHQDQISGKNKFGVPITQKNAIIKLSQNNSCHNHKYKNIEHNEFKENEFLNESLKVEITITDELIKKSTPSDSDNQNVTHQCEGITRIGERCKNKFKYQGKFCHKHNKSAEELNTTFFVPGFVKRKNYSINGKYRK